MAESALRNLQRERMNARRERIGMEPFVPQAPTKTAGQAMADMLGGMSIPLSFVPVAGDVAGLAADAAMYATRPEERTLSNAAMTLAGIVPGIPGAAAIRAGGQAAEGALDMSKVAGTSTTKTATDAYGMAHRPLTDAGGAARLHDLVPAFGNEIYGPNALQFFGSGDPRETSILRILKQVRNNPSAKVKIYRGVPKDVSGINAGDWVTLDKRVAQDYARLQNGKVVETDVPASTITSWADSLMEFGYYP